MNEALSTSAITTRRYLIEPGDATRYNFMIHWFAHADERVPAACSEFEDYELKTYIESNVQPERVISGIESGGYIGITVSMPYPDGNGTYEFMFESIRRAEEHTMRYFAEKIGCRLNLARPIVLACSVLIDQPNNLAGAIKAMRAGLGIT